MPADHAAAAPTTTTAATAAPAAAATPATAASLSRKFIVDDFLQFFFCLGEKLFVAAVDVLAKQKLNFIPETDLGPLIQLDFSNLLVSSQLGRLWWPWRRSAQSAVIARSTL